MLERLVTTLRLHELTLLSVLDILILAVIIYQLLLMIRGTRSFSVLLAIASLVVFYAITGRLVELKGLHAALGHLLIYVPFAIIVLFQNQIRRALANIGANPLSLFLHKKVEESVVEEIVLAAASMASKRLGALIVIERGIGLRSFADTGITLDARVSYDLLMNIFTQKSPLHDGAVIIAENRVRAASCYLPLTTNATLSRTYGTRHRAAIGITEESDAVVIIVSEERGELSIAQSGRITAITDARGLERALDKALAPPVEIDRSKLKVTKSIATPEASDA